MLNCDSCFKGRASFKGLSNLLQACRQLHSEALPVYRSCVELEFPQYSLRSPKGFDRFIQQLDERNDFKPPFRGFRNISLSIDMALEHMPIVARFCPSMQRLTVEEDSPSTYTFDHYTWIDDHHISLEAAFGSQDNQKAVFSCIHKDDDDMSGEFSHALLDSKSSLGEITGLGFMKDVTVFLRHGLRSSNWVIDDLSTKKDILSQELRSCLCYFDADLIQLGTFDVQTGMLHVQAPEGEFDVMQERYTPSKLGTK